VACSVVAILLLRALLPFGSMGRGPTLFFALPIPISPSSWLEGDWADAIFCVAQPPQPVGFPSFAFISPSSAIQLFLFRLVVVFV
jgi:hypothetical protein